MEMEAHLSSTHQSPSWAPLLAAAVAETVGADLAGETAQGAWSSCGESRRSMELATPMAAGWGRAMGARRSHCPALQMLPPAVSAAAMAVTAAAMAAPGAE